MVTAKRYTPKALVSFSTEQGDITLRVNPEAQGFSIDKQVLSISTNNDISADAGTFQITLTADKRWDKYLASNDFVRIQLYRDDTNLGLYEATVMMGLIDDVRKGISIQGATPQRTVTVTGRTFAKALINFEVGVVQGAPVISENSLGWIAGRINFKNLSAGEVAEQIFDELVYKYMNYEFKNGQTLKSMTNLHLSSRPGETLFDDQGFVNYQGSMQSFLKEIANEPWNQIYWEFYGDGQSTFVLRETPFNQSTWNALPMHTVTDEEVVADSIGRSDIETYAFYTVGLSSYFSTFDISKSTGVLPYWYEPYHKKFGVRRLHRLTGYAMYGATEDEENAANALKAYQRDLFNWNIHNPNFYNGFLTVIGQHEYKIGDRLLYKSVEDERDIEFFIESVSHDFTNYGTWTTKLGLTRGLPDSGKGRFNAPWGSYTEYSGGALGAPILGDAEETGNNFTPVIIPGINATFSPEVSSILNYAKSFIGKTKYVWGGGRTESDIKNGYFDCSGFVNHVFKQHGINLGSGNTDTLAKQGVAVNTVMALKPGDLVFFNTYKYNGHVGIFLGDGKWIGCQSNGGVGIVDWNDSYFQKAGVGSLRRVIVDGL